MDEFEETFRNMRRDAERYRNFAKERESMGNKLEEMAQALKEMKRLIDPASLGRQGNMSHIPSDRRQEIIRELYASIQEGEHIGIAEIEQKYPDISSGNAAGIFSKLRTMPNIALRKENVRNVAFYDKEI